MFLLLRNILLQNILGYGTDIQGLGFIGLDIFDQALFPGFKASGSLFIEIRVTKLLPLGGDPDPQIRLHRFPGSLLWENPHFGSPIPLGST
jgi:hypothetical protein